MFDGMRPVCEPSGARRGRMSRAFRLELAGIVLAFAWLGAANPPLCTATPGGQIVLSSDASDPDVFLWDSRDRMAIYAAGQWSNTHAIFNHTVLAEPGTRAVVVSCIASAAHPKFGLGDVDALGVKLTSGPYRGRFGWILASDAHPARGTTNESASAPPKVDY